MVGRQYTQNPEKFNQDNFGSNNADYIPGESDRDRRLRLRAMERASRLDSAKSGRNMDPIPQNAKPNLYQENVKFPENSVIEMDSVKPARPMGFEDNQNFYPRTEFARNETYDTSNHTAHSSAETFKRDPVAVPPLESHREPITKPQESQEFGLGVYPGLSQSNDAFRQKQAEMKKEMKQDFQQFIHNNQNVDARKQKIQRQRQSVQDAGGYKANNLSYQAEDDRRSQIANDVFNEILQKKGQPPPVYPSTNMNQHPDYNMGGESHHPPSQPRDDQSSFMFKDSEDDQRRQQKLKQQEYGSFLRSQMGSNQSRRPQQQEQNTYAPIIEKIGSEQNRRGPKVDKKEYRLELERQIEEKKIQQEKQIQELKQEDYQFQQNPSANSYESNTPQYQNIQSERAGSAYDQNRSQAAYPETNQYARQQSFTAQRTQSSQDINKKLEYQAQLKAQIEENKQRANQQKQKEKEQEEYEERMKNKERYQLQSEF